MKKLFTLIFLFFSFISVWSQTPQGISFQSIARNATGIPITNRSLQVKFSVLDSVATGNIIYAETHNTITSNLGLFSLQVGLGSPIASSFSNINWGKNSKFLKIELDTNNTSNWILLGTQQMLSVPYSMWSANGLKPATNVGDMLYWNGTNWLTVPAGVAGQVLTFDGLKPTWSSITSMASVSPCIVSNVLTTNALLNATLLDNGGAAILSEGFCWDTFPNPTILKSSINVFPRVGYFYNTITGLKPNKTYYARAFATSALGTAYSTAVSFTTLGIAVTPPVSNTLFIIGSATFGGWNNPVPTPSQQFTKLNATLYEITLPLTAGNEFLFLRDNGNWSNKYASNIVYTPSTTSYQTSFADFSTGGGNNFKSPPVTGKYKISVDFESGFYSVSKVADTLILSFSKDTVLYDGFDTTAITVRDITGTDVTSSSNIYVNGNYLVGNTFIASALANASVYASNLTNTTTSATRTIFVKAPTASPFTKKILVEQVGGAWNGYDPRVTYKLDNYKTAKPNCILMRIHGGSGTDPYKYQNYSTYVSAFGIGGYPAVITNRQTTWSENNADLDAALTAPAPLGLAIQSSLSGTTISGTVSVKFDVTTSRPMKIVVALVENSLLYNQVNYYGPTGGATPYLYGGANPILNFSHNYVLRKTYTDVFGDAIPIATQVKGGVYSLPFAMTTSGVISSGASYTVIPANCSIVAFVIDDTNVVRGVYNVQTAPVGTTKNYD